ncbi:MAG: SpoIIE family protein phosphatase [Omnitrophica WOR_2 bacterium]
MAIKLRNFWQILSRSSQDGKVVTEASSSAVPQRVITPGIELPVDDQIVEYFQKAPGVVEIDKLDFDSPALKALKKAGVKVAVPLVSQGELIGLLNLGPRLSEQEYSADDFGLLNNLATQAAPALRVAQLVRQQQAEAQSRERIEHELRVARLIQQTLLPRKLPVLPGWHLAAYYQPARAVGGDFYDFYYLKDGRLGIVIGDVTDKGVPAALVMATTRSVLRGAAEQSASPGEVLERANNLLCPDIPEKMFITCLYAILDTHTGHLVYANAGHDLPYYRSCQGVSELRATGMPLGLMTNMKYEEKEVTLVQGESALFYSDGLVEAHNPRGEMFGFPRLRDLVGTHPGGEALIEFLLGNLGEFTGAGWEQEDDVTFLTLERTEGFVNNIDENHAPGKFSNADKPGDSWRILADFSMPSQPGNERKVMEQVADFVTELNLPVSQVERLKTAVSEATMNAMEHGNHYQADLAVNVKVLASPEDLVVQITDHGGGRRIFETETPDLEAKLAGLQTPRGWGLFLIKNMVDEMNINADADHHTIELIIHRKEGEHGSKTL